MWLESLVLVLFKNPTRLSDMPGPGTNSVTFDHGGAVELVVFGAPIHMLLLPGDTEDLIRTYTVYSIVREAVAYESLPWHQNCWTKYDLQDMRILRIG